MVVFFYNVGIVRLLIFAFEKPLMINGIYHLFENNYLISVLIFIMIIFLSYIYTIKISASYFLRCYHYLNCFTKPRFHANISKYFNKNPYILNEWCRVSRNKELLFYSNLKSVITVYLLVNLFQKNIWKLYRNSKCTKNSCNGIMLCYEYNFQHIIYQ